MKANVHFLSLLIIASLLLALFGLPMTVPAPTVTAQSGSVLKAVVGQAEKADLSPALRELAAASNLAQSGTVYREIPRIDRPLAAQRSEQPAADPAIQSVSAPNAMPAPIANFDGVPNVDNVAPPDTEGDIGYDPATGKKYYMQWVNSHFAVWDVSTPTAPSNVITYTAGSALWAGTGTRCATDNSGDPIVLFDQLANRWLATQFAVSTSPYYECIAVSQTADPAGAWYRYAFNLGTTMNDYPHFGIWPDAYYMTDNQFAGGSSWAGAGVYAFDRAKMLTGDPTASYVYFNLYDANANFGGMLPSDLDGAAPPVGTPNVFMEVDDSATLPTATDVLSLWEFHVDWATPANSTFGLNGQPNYQLVVDNFNPICANTRDCVPQPGSTQKLDAIGDRIMHRLAYRNVGSQERWVLNHTVDAGSGRAAVRWYEVRRSGAAPAIYQQGTFAPTDTTHRWMGSAAMDHAGNLAIGYSASNATTVYPSLYYAGRLASDPLGQLAQGEATLFAGNASQNGVNRWGDYSSLTIDPVDDCTFWFTSEYSTGGWDWRTRIGSFKFPGCALGPQGRIVGAVTNVNTSAPLAGAQVQATVSPTQTGSTASGATGAYAIDVPVGNYTVTASLYGYQSYTSPSAVSVVSGTTTTHNIALTPLPSYAVSGYVTDIATGWPLYAQLNVSAPGWTGQSLWSDPVTGYYSFTLTAGPTHTIQAQTWIQGYSAKSVNVAPLSGNTTLNIGLAADLVACNAPGYRLTGGLAERFDALTPPDLGGWASTVVSAVNAPTWATNAGTKNPSGVAAHSAPNLAYFNSYDVHTGGSARLARVAGLDMTGVTSTTLSFWMYHDPGYSSYVDQVQVQVSINGGTTWLNVDVPVSRYRATASWLQHSVDLIAYAAQTDLRLAFLGISAYGNDIHIDDIVMGTPTCVSPSGGLVVGHVYDDNTALALNGASVVGPAGAVTTSPTTDLLTNDGFFITYAPAGFQTFTATMAGGYVPASQSVSVAAGGTVARNFNLLAGQIAVNAPVAATDVTVALNATASTNITVSNLGGATANYSIIGVNAPFTPLQYNGPFADHHRHLGPKNFNLTSLQGVAYYQVAPTVPQYPLAGTVFATWTTGLLAAWGVGVDTLADNLWVGNIKAYGGDDVDYQFTRNGSLTGLTVSANLGGTFAADMTYNPYTAMLWQVNVGGDNCIYELNPKTQTQTGNKLCPTFGTNQRGLAYDPATDTFYTGSWNDSIINHFDAGGMLMDSVDVGVSIAGLAYNPATQHLFVSCNGDATVCPFDIYVLDTANAYANLGGFNVTGLGDYAQAGLDMSCDGHLWAANQTTKVMLEVDSGEAGVCNWMATPWLSWAPIAGTLTSDLNQSVALAFDASQVAQPGIYQAMLRVMDDTPYAAQVFGVKMTVNPSPAMGKLTGLVNGLAACDVNPTPMPDAVIYIDSGSGLTWTLKTDPAGRYQFWLPAANSPLTVTISNKAGYQAQQKPNVQITATQTTTLNVNLRPYAPCASALPNQLTSTQKANQVTTKTLTIGNLGTVPFGWTIGEQLSLRPIESFSQLVFAAPSAPAARTAPAQTGRAAPVYASRPNAVLLSERFEDGVVPPTGWTAVVTNTAFTWKLGSTAHDGSGAADIQYDDTLAPQDEWLLSPVMALSAGTLSFWSQGSAYWCRDDYDNCDLDVWLVVGALGGGDDVYLGQGDTAWPGSWTWVQSVFTLTSVLPTSPVRIGFNYTGIDGAEVILDDVMVDGTTCHPNALPWLTTSLISGTVGADSQTVVSVTFNSTGLASGNYTGNLCVSTTDPHEPLILVPVRLSVSYNLYLPLISHNYPLFAPMFEAMPLSGTVPLTVTFTNLASGNLTDSLWDFGDNTGSTQHNPIHPYTTPGTYTVTLIVSNTLGSGMLIRPSYITVLPDLATRLMPYQR